ncbi:MAG: HNH endonuclease [Patescibacteria group bacterium]|nr:HNH endonuclease [Patescibacteria group bacterium]
MLRKNRKISQWIAEHQGKYKCHCGCGFTITITTNHARNGIPKYLWGHHGRKDLKNLPKTMDFQRVSQWMENEQGKHFCQCGCKQPILISRSHYANGIPKYLWGHHQRVRKYPSDVDRFWIKVDKKEEDECWKWIPCKDRENQYGQIRSKNLAVKGLAHRLSYLIHYGSLDPNLDVLHTCDHPWCVNPKHLFLGTHAENMKDAKTKGRMASGSNHPRAKLNDNDIRTIRHLRKTGRKQEDIAKLFGVSACQISSICSGKSWGWVLEVE